MERAHKRFESISHCMNGTSKQTWMRYCEKECVVLIPLLSHLGYTLDLEQPLIGGEKYLMRAVTTESGRKLILLGTRASDGKRVIIKTASDTDGRVEIECEIGARRALEKMQFAYNVFFSPEELLLHEENGFFIFIQEYLQPEIPFLERQTSEQFTLALNAFKAQESAHAATFEHIRETQKIFGNQKDSGDYLLAFAGFQDEVKRILPEAIKTHNLMDEAYTILKKHSDTVDQYSGFLTHTDFVPHNFRVVQERIYLLDHSAIRFANKYEGWARFINFMELYNAELARILEKYVLDNRAPEEVISLRLMRLYRLGEIIFYYCDKLPKSEGPLLELNRARFDLWSHVLETNLKGTTPDSRVLADYKQTRGSLRSEDEVKRQKVLH